MRRGIRGALVLSAIALSTMAAVGCASGPEMRPLRDPPRPSTLHQCVQLPSRLAGRFRKAPGYEQFEVAVIDPSNAPPAALGAGSFLLTTQTLIQPAEFAEYVSSATASVAILIDTSSNAEDKITQERDFAGALVRSLEPRDDVALLVYSRRGYLLQPMTSDRGGPLAMLPLVKASGSAALYDAAAQGIRAAFNSACYARRSLVIISSGFDNGSRLTAPDVIEHAHEQGVAIYFVGVGISDSPRDEKQQAALKAVTAIVSASGGQIFPVGESADREAVQSIARQISANMRGQYVVGFIPSIADGSDGAVEIEGHPEYLVVSRLVAEASDPDAPAASEPGPHFYHSPQFHGVFLPEK